MIVFLFLSASCLVVGVLMLVQLVVAMTSGFRMNIFGGITHVVFCAANLTMSAWCFLRVLDA